MSGAIKERFLKEKADGRYAVSEEEANAALLNPVFRETLTMITDIKVNHGINLLDYDSFEEYTFAYLSSLDTKVLECIKHCLDSIGIPDEVLDAVLEIRLTNTAVSI